MATEETLQLFRELRNDPKIDREEVEKLANNTQQFCARKGLHYPCVSNFRFMHSRALFHSGYKFVLEESKKREKPMKVLDIGWFVPPSTNI